MQLISELNPPTLFFRAKSKHDSFSLLLMFHYFTKNTKMWFHRWNPPIINGLTGFQTLGSMPCCHTLLHCSKIVSVSSPTRLNLTLLILLAPYLFIFSLSDSYSAYLTDINRNWFLSILFRIWCSRQIMRWLSTTRKVIFKKLVIFKCLKTVSLL